MIWRASNSPNILRSPCNLWPVASTAALRLNDADRYRDAVPSPIDALDQSLADGAICRAWERNWGGCGACSPTKNPCRRGYAA
jgi:hypothetical protein